MITRKKLSDDKSWSKRIEEGVRSRDRYDREWKRNRRLMTGNYGVSKNGKIVSKIGWSAYQTMVGTVFAQTPRPIVREKNQGLENTAQMITQIATDGLEEMNARYFTRAAIQDVFWAGFSVVMQRLDQDTDSGAPKNQAYSLLRIHPKAFVNDPKAVMPDQYDAGWAAIETYPTVKSLKEDEDLNVNKTVLSSLRLLTGPPQASAYPQSRNTWNSTPNGANDFVAPQDDDDEFQVARIMEIYDRQNKSILYQPTGSSTIIGERDWPVEPWYNNQLLFPWTVLYFNENPDEFWPIPEMSMIADEIEQLAVADRYILSDMVSKWRKVLVRSDAFKGQGTVAQLLNAGGTEVIRVTDNLLGEKVRLDDMAYVLPDSSTVKQDVLATAAYKKQQIHETVGAGDFASGGMRNTRSATEAAALSDFLRVRTTTRTENIDAFFKKLVRMYILFLQQTATETRWAKVSDGTGIAAWHEYDKDAIKGDFDFTVIAGSSMPKNTDSARERNLALFQQIAPLVQQSGGNLQPFIEWIAPYFDMPQHKIDQVFANHKGALEQLATVFAAIHAGAHVEGSQIMELIASAVNTGLNQQDLQKVQQAGLAQAQSQKVQGQLQGQGGAPPPAQPQGLPGTNTSVQTQ